MSTKLVINSVVEGRTEELPDRWRSVQEELGLYAYGETADEAAARMRDALSFLVDTLIESGGIEAVTSRFERAGIKVEIAEKSEDEPRTFPLVLTLSRSLDQAS